MHRLALGAADSSAAEPALLVGEVDAGKLGAFAGRLDGRLIAAACFSGSWRRLERQQDPLKQAAV